MTTRPFWQSLGVRGKINLILIPAVLPMLAIATIAYLSHRDSSIETGNRAMELIAGAAAERVDAHFQRQASVFAEWTAEDIYGLAIEFGTVAEMGEQFATMLEAAPGFGVLMVTDASGTVLQCGCRAEQGEVAIGTFNGRQAADAIRGAPRSRWARFGASDILSAAGQPYAQTFQMGVPAKGTAGDIKGYFLAIPRLADGSRFS